MASKTFPNPWRALRMRHPSVQFLSLSCSFGQKIISWAPHLCIPGARTRTNCLWLIYLTFNLNFFTEKHHTGLCNKCRLHFRRRFVVQIITLTSPNQFQQSPLYVYIIKWKIQLEKNGTQTKHIEWLDPSVRSLSQHKVADAETPLQ